MSHPIAGVYPTYLFKHTNGIVCPFVVMTRDGDVFLPVRLVDKGRPALSVKVADLKGSGVHVNFSNGETELVVLVDDVTWLEVGIIPTVIGPLDVVLKSGSAGTLNTKLTTQVNNAGTYIAKVPTASFTRVRQGPISWGVFPA